MSNVVIVQRDGPNMVSGDLVVVTPVRVRTMKSAMLCRCGRSSDKPFCDGKHVKIGFADPALLPNDAVSETTGTGTLTITPLPDGPLRCDGPLVIRDAEGRTCASESTLLCRCGGSHRKPFCDGTHKRIGFTG